MDERDGTIGQRASEVARAFGSLVRRRRRALTMTQDQLALITGVGRRFLIDLEAGKTSCQLGRSLVVAHALGLRPTDGLNGDELNPSATVPDLPDLPDDEEQALFDLLVQEAQRMDDDGNEGAFDRSPLRRVYQKLLEKRHKK